MNMNFLVILILLISQISFLSNAESQTVKNKPSVVKKKKVPKSESKKASSVKTNPPPPSAQAVAETMPTKTVVPVVLPPMGDYKYELNFAPLAILANWYTIDFLKYEPSSEDDLEHRQFGYGVSAVSFIRNSNNVDDTFPSRVGYGAGLTAVWDHRDYYLATHGYYEKFERYRDEGTLVQEREGFRINAIVGLKEVIKRRYALKFGWGIEAQTYRVREFNETNRFVQTNYQTNILNPFFLECKLSMYF